VEGLDERLAGGDFVDRNGKVLGKHEGYPFYTVGQRKGLGIALGEPMFVTEIRPETNIVVLGREEELIRNHTMVGKVNLMKYEKLPQEGLEVVTKIRYRDSGTLSTARQVANDLEISFHANVKGIAPGQSAVLYEGDDVVGGGIIQGNGEFMLAN
jgi:tRNA-specific 2-thiouridylase